MSGSPQPTRLAALDMTKGVLVFFMVAYHSLNYSNQYFLGFRYLSFLPPSFILISGFVISKIYSSRYDARDKRMHRRLVTRGVKLLLLFTALNVAMQLLLGRNRHGQSSGVADYFRHWPEVYLTGSGRYAAFSVLLPIAYLLMFAPAVILVSHWRPIALPVLTALLCGLSVALEMTGIANFNLNLFTAGILGMLLGGMSDRFLYGLRNVFLLSALVYGFSFYLGTIYGETFAIQLIGAVAALSAIFSFCLKIGEFGRGPSLLALMGRYSLISYIVQIATLQALSLLIGRPNPLSLGSVGLFVGTSLIMILAIRSIDFMRVRSPYFAHTYKALFA